MPEPTEIIYSPLAPDQQAELLYERSCDDLIARWQKAYDIDISSQFEGLTSIRAYHCPKSKLTFFQPWSAAGNEVLYQQLQQFDWYYAESKWEYAQALQELPANAKVLEIGCGKGEFLALLKEQNIEAEGLEINTEAIQQARERELTVHHDDLHDFANQHPQTYDCLCAFQVLEHVTEPLAFLQSMRTLLRPGGSLILATPNHDAFIKNASNPLLDMPPHHMSCWTLASYQYVAEQLGLRLTTSREEPLAKNHIDFYLRTRYVQRLKQGKAMWPFQCTRPFYHALLWAGLRHFYAGHTLYIHMSDKAE